MKTMEPPESNDPELVMPAALDSLYAEFTANSYTTYPIGFYHTVKLSGKDTEKMAGLLSELTGKPRKSFLARLDTDAYEPNSVLAVIGGRRNHPHCTSKTHKQRFPGSGARL